MFISVIWYTPHNKTHAISQPVFLEGKENYLSFSHDGQKVPTFAKESQVHIQEEFGFKPVKLLCTVNIIKDVKTSSKLLLNLKALRY